MKTNLTINVTIRKNKWWWVKLKVLLFIECIRLIHKQDLIDWINITSQRSVKFKTDYDNVWRWLPAPVHIELAGV